MNELELGSKLQSSDLGDVIESLQYMERRKEMHDLSATIAHIRHTDQGVRRAAISATVSIIRFSIIENYHDLGREGRNKLAEIIDRIHPETVQDLLRAAHSNSEEDRIQSLMILGLLRRREPIRRLIEQELKSANVRIRATAIQAMGNYPDSSEHLLLLRQLNDNDSRVRANAIEALEQFGDPKLVFSLKRLLNDGNNRVRANALKALYNQAGEDIENDIITMLSDRSPAMIASALWLVAELHLDSPEIHHYCRQFENHIDPMIQRNCQRALKLFTHL